MMTSFAFILGVVPLILRWAPAPRCGRPSASPSSAACSASPSFGIFLTPVFYFVIQWASDIAPSAASAGLLAETAENGTPYHDESANSHPRPPHHGEEFDGVGDGAIGHPSAHDEDLLATGADIGD